jgi:hypothetical protein
VVSPDDLAVLDADEREILTLVTCYPFYFVGPAPPQIHRSGGADHITQSELLFPSLSIA